MAPKKPVCYSKISTGVETPFFFRGTVVEKDEDLPPRQRTQEIFLDGSYEDKVARLIEKVISLTDRVYDVELSIHNLARRTSQLNNTTDVMNSQVSDLRPDVRSVRTEISEVFGRMLALESKVQSVEGKAAILLSRPHECIQDGVIQSMREETKTLQTDIKQATERIVATATALEKGAEPAVQEIKAARQRFIGLVITIVLAVIAAAAGWIATFSALRKDVQHLNEQQKSMETEVTKSREAVKHRDLLRDKQLRRLEDKMGRLNVDSVAFDDWYNRLSLREKARLRRVIGDDRLPNLTKGD